MFLDKSIIKDHILIPYKHFYYDSGVRCRNCSLAIFYKASSNVTLFTIGNELYGRPIEKLNLSCVEILIKALLE